MMTIFWIIMTLTAILYLITAILYLITAIFSIRNDIKYYKYLKKIYSLEEKENQNEK